jgi:N-methylhydantoinase A
MSWSIGVDVGGTFTDFHALESGSGASRVLKLPSTPDNPARAIALGLTQLLAGGIPAQAVVRLAHGTTVATNALIQRRGPAVAVITTAGFRDLLEIGRQTRPRLYDFQADHPPALAPRELRFEVVERIGADGAVVCPLDQDSLAAAVAQVRDSGAAACAVCLLFSFLNPAHERAVGRALAAAVPGLHVSLSSDVQPEFREYERFSTALVNAWLQPLLTAYMDTLEHEVGKLLPAARLGINQSSGGLMSAARARAYPVRTALSGPAAGVVGAVHVARVARCPDVITLDMGGTSADVCLVRGYRADIGFARKVADFPIRLPMVDVHTVGAGGGSIAWFDRDGLLKVGPHSAGADPGPACYGQGGGAATVTDANLLLGRLSTRGLLGGGMPLDEAAARAAIAPLARRLGFSPERTALGILDIVTATMVRAIRAVSVERGHDPRECQLLAYGGAGALHARQVASELDMRRVLVPPAPGILCAQGLVVADLAEELVRSRRVALGEDGVAALAGMLRALWPQALAWFEHEAIAPGARAAELILDMRYVGQNFELRVPVAESTGDAPVLPPCARLRALFDAAHEQVYGYANSEDPVEVVNLRLVLRGVQPAQCPPPAEASRDACPDHAAMRPVHFDDAGALDTPVFERATLAPGHRIAGPAIVEQLDATTVLAPGDVARVDAAGNLLIDLPDLRRAGIPCDDEPAT